MVWVRNCAGLVYDNVPPERLEHFVRSTPEDDCVEARNIFRGHSSLFFVGHHPVQVTGGPAKYPFAVTQLNITIRRIHSIPDIVHAP